MELYFVKHEKTFLRQGLTMYHYADQENILYTKRVRLSRHSLSMNDHI